jgi:hypothetical protein
MGFPAHVLILPCAGLAVGWFGHGVDWSSVGLVMVCAGHGLGWAGHGLSWPSSGHGLCWPSRKVSMSQGHMGWHGQVMGVS